MRTLLCCLLFAVVAPAAALDFRTTPVLTNAGSIVDLVNAGDGTQRLYLVDQDGTIRIFAAGTLRAEPFLDISDRIATIGGEQGLLSAVFPPDYTSKRYFYALYTAIDRSIIVARYRVSADNARADGSSEQIVLRVPHPETTHNGGKLLFGPDGYLYARSATVVLQTIRYPPARIAIPCSARSCASTPKRAMQRIACRQPIRSWASRELDPRSGRWACAIPGA